MSLAELPELGPAGRAGACRKDPTPTRRAALPLPLPERQTIRWELSFRLSLGTWRGK